MHDDDISAVGQHFLIGLQPSTSLHAKDRALLRALRPAGIILYKSNFRHDLPYIDWLGVYSQLIDDIRATIERDKLLIAIDHEGGRVCRTPAPITRYSYASRWATSARDVGRAMGVELASLGVNLNFAPVLDIHSNPHNPVIVERAFDSSPDTVAAAAVAFIEGSHSAGVLCCGKHFPGHGDTDTDSHHALPVLDCSMEELRQRELIPFAAAVAAKIPMLMTSHILFPKIDSQYPATLSDKLTGEVLRQELGYDNVIVSDDIGMRAMDAYFDDPGAPARLIESGSDMLMVCAHGTDTDRARMFAQNMLRAIANGEVSANKLEDSRRRISTLLDVAPSHVISVLPSSSFDDHSKLGETFKAATVEVV